MGDVCSWGSLDSLGKDKCVSVLGGLIQPTPACKYTNSPAWNKNTNWIMVYLPPCDLLMLLDADLSLNRRWPSTSLPTPTSWLISPEISKFNPLLLPSSLIPADRGLGTTNTWGLVGSISLCNAFTCMATLARVWLFIIVCDAKWVTWHVCANVPLLDVSVYSCAQVCPSKCNPPEEPPWWADLFVE